MSGSVLNVNKDTIFYWILSPLLLRAVWLLPISLLLIVSSLHLLSILKIYTKITSSLMIRLLIILHSELNLPMFLIKLTGLPRPPVILSLLEPTTFLPILSEFLV
jgi:hypothetical protein